jgi:ribosome-associated protein
MNLEQMRQATIEALDDLKGRDIVVLDTSRLSSLFECVIIASGDSTRQTKAMARRVQDRLRALGAGVVGVEGAQEGDWILVDMGSLVVHIMHPATRAYYNLEELWSTHHLPAARLRAAAT